MLNDKTIEMIRKRRGLAENTVFNLAIDTLQAAGFITELWVSKKGVALRWRRNSSRWHTSSDVFGNIEDQFCRVGQKAIYWCKARENGTGNETQFAVKES